MTVYVKAPGDKPESTERQADIAELESLYKFRISDHRHNQVRNRCWNSYGLINTRVSKHG